MPGSGTPARVFHSNKHLSVKIILALLLASLAPACALDHASFGNSLNGWQRDGSARYSLDGARYRTLKPVEATDAEGNTTVRVTVIPLPNSWAEVPFDLAVTFGPDGSAQALRISGSPRGQKVDTGAISRPSAPEAPAAGSPAPAAAPFHPVAEMKKMLFDSFEPQVTRAAEAKDTRKRDLLARIAGPEPIDPVALGAGLRYNLDLILRGPVAAPK